MAEITLTAEAGRQTGSRPSGRMRVAGRVPGVVYGHGIEPLAVSVDGRELRAALSTPAGLNALLSLDVGGHAHLTLARELQRHPVRNTVTHVDFQIVRRDEVVSADVPVVLVGEALQVSQNRGVIEQPITSLTVHAIPSRIPNTIEVDVTELDPDDAVVLAQGSAASEAASGAEGAEAAEAAEPAEGS